jgi:capsular polysaccharide biosynthesis protein
LPGSLSVAGFRASAALLAGADVLISAHGADMVNGLLLPAGASVVEVMPVVKRGCPCSMYCSEIRTRNLLIPAG